VLSLSDALGGWRPRSGAWPGDDPVVLLGAVWPEIVGSDVARNSHPVRITADSLHVVTTSSAWSHQLSLLSERIVTAVMARLPASGIQQLRFRVGKLPARAVARPVRAPQRAPGANAAATRAPAETAGEALAHFREAVVDRQRAKRASGWKECIGCAALVAPGGAAFCAGCLDARVEERTAATARLLFEAPWLGYRGTAALIDGLTHQDYESIRRRLLARWWQTLAAALKAKRLSRDGRERTVASSYVVLKSELPPDEIRPATVRNVLGDELHDLIYGTER
jgi:Dna[CI] antecedent, DciA